MSSDIRKWFMKSHGKDEGGNNNASKSSKSGTSTSVVKSEPEKPVQGGQESSGRRKTSKYFADKQKSKEDKDVEELPVKRKVQKDNEKSLNLPPSKKPHKVESDDDDDDFVMPISRKSSADATPNKKLKTGSGRGVAKKVIEVEDIDEDDVKDVEPSPKPSGRGRGGRGASAGRGRGGGGGGRGGFMNFVERKDPPHKGEKEVPEGASNCLAGLTFVISGTLDSLEREEAEDLIKRHDGRVTGSVSKKTTYLLCDEDIGGRKSEKAKELGTTFLTEDGLFDMIRASKSSKPPQVESKKSSEKVVPKKSPLKAEDKKDLGTKPIPSTVSRKELTSNASTVKRKDLPLEKSTLPWNEKYRPKVPNDIIGNQSNVKILHDWLARWSEQFLNTGKKGKGKKQNDSGAKKSVLISGSPGIGKTTTAKLVSQMLGFQVIEVNASDSRGKADSKIERGIGGSNANSVKELVSNEALSITMDWSKHPKTVLIMDEVDGMSAGDRGGIADLIASIKISKVPIICICNDRYSQKLKSLSNYCEQISFRKPTKQQMAKRLMQVANAEGLQVNEIALEELAERVNGDMRMALNQLQYMSLSMSAIKYDDIRQRLLSSSKDEDISPFTAVDKLFGYNGGKLRMDERVDLSMSDPDLIPLLVQENYLHYRPTSTGKDDNGLKRMQFIARAAESLGNGDIINVQIRRYRQWQLSQAGSLASCILPAALMHGQREALDQGRNYNRFPGWLGKNSTIGKSYRLMEDLHMHFLASRESNSGREALRLDYLNLLLKRLTEPLRKLPKDEAVREVVDLMNVYSMSQEDFDTVVELSKFQGHPNPLDGIQPAVKAALTKAYKEESKSRMVRAADLITLPGMKKAPKKRIAAILEPADAELGNENGEALAENEEEESSDTEGADGTANGEKLQSELQSLNSKGIQVQVDLKGTGNANAKKGSAGRGRGGGRSAGPAQTKTGRGSGSGSKRKR